MVTDATIDRAAANVPPIWRTYPGKRLTIHALEGSYAAKRASSELREAERVVAAFADILKPADEQAQNHIHIYLVDPIAETMVGSVIQAQHHTDQGQHGTARGDVIVRIIQPEAPGEPVAWPLARLLIPRWFGPRAGEATLFTAGLAGIVAARTGTGPTIKEIDGWVRGELEAGRSISILTQARATRGMANSASARTAGVSSNDRAATAFVNFLIKEFGAASLSAFFQAYDPDRRDQAALTAYQRTLGTLEETWLATLRRRPGSGTAFQALFRHLGPYIKPYWRREIEVLVYIVFGLAYSLVLPLAFKYLIDSIIPSGNLNMLAVLSVLLLVTYILNSAIYMRRLYVTHWINQSILLGLQSQMFAQLQRLPHSFYTKAKVGDLLSRLSSDLQLVNQAMSQVIGNGVFLALRALVAAIAVMVLSPLLGALVLVVVPIFAVSYFMLRSRLQQASYESQKLMGEATTAAQENLSAQTVIKAFGLEERAINSYGARLRAILNVFLRLVIIASLFETSIGLAVTLGQLIVVGVGGYLVITGQLTVGTLIASVALLPSLFEPIAALANVTQSVEKASGALDRVDELLQEPVIIADKPSARPLAPLAHEIRFADVTFGYDSDRLVLRDLNLTIPAGSHVSIVGPSGSGKSTIVNLLLRFWDPDQGSVLFDGQDLRDATLASLRGMIGIVFQDTFIFDSSLRDNIAIGRPDATDAEVIAAAKAAKLDAYIDTLPNKYDTVLGERGVMMSGGQRQRLAIARALLRDPRILILDEATSALDAQTEREILETLDELARDRTTVSITHRLALAATADQIVVLDQGRVVEQGHHDELVHAGGLYQRLYEEQVNPISGGGGYDKVKAARLQTIPLFTGLKGEALARMADRLMIEQYSAGETVVRQGEPGDKMYIISRGQVDVVVDDAGAERRIATLETGDYFGEMALLAGEPRTATVRSTIPTQLYSLTQADFAALLEREPEIRRAVMAVVETRRSAFSAVVAAAATDAVTVEDT
jgi:ABC-type multidrug transport system fused ATPase/permease subunit